MRFVAERDVAAFGTVAAVVTDVADGAALAAFHPVGNPGLRHCVWGFLVDWFWSLG